MKPSGVIYRSSAFESHGEARVALTEKEKKNFKLIRFLGINLSSFALAFTIFTYGPNFKLDLNYQAGLLGASDSQPSISQRSKVNDSNDPIESLHNDAADQFAVFIPAIGAIASVVPDVNPFDESAYLSALKLGVAHAAGTGKPGEGKRVYLFAHSTNSPVNFSEYNAIFYQLRLLNKGDRIIISYNDDSYSYVVREKVVVSANDTHWLTETPSEEELVLQTCDPPGTTLRRLLVIAEPV